MLDHSSVLVPFDVAPGRQPVDEWKSAAEEDQQRREMTYLFTEEGTSPTRIPTTTEHSDLPLHSLNLSLARCRILDVRLLRDEIVNSQSNTARLRRLLTVGSITLRSSMSCLPSLFSFSASVSSSSSCDAGSVAFCLPVCFFGFVG